MDVDYNIREADYALDHLGERMKQERIHTPLPMQPGHVRVRRDPLGVTLIIGAWNEPYMLTLCARRSSRCRVGDRSRGPAREVRNVHPNGMTPRVADGRTIGCTTALIKTTGGPSMSHTNGGKQHYVVVLGGGFAGVGAVKRLARKDGVAVTLIDRHNYHQFQPLRYQVATSQLASSDIAFSLRKLFRNHENVDVKLGDVVALDTAARSVTLADGESFAGDSLVLAAGSRPNFFHTPGAEEHALPLYSLEDATRLRSRLLTVFEAADRDPTLIDQGALTFVVVGGGPTGVELAGALADLIAETMSVEYHHLAVSAAQIHLVDLSVADLPGVYAIGDNANIPGPDGEAYPQLGSVALQSGTWAAQNILADAAGMSRKPFHYHDKGIMAMIGRGAAIAEVGSHRHELHGAIAFCVARLPRHAHDRCPQPRRRVHRPGLGLLHQGARAAGTRPRGCRGDQLGRRH